MSIFFFIGYAANTIASPLLINFISSLSDAAANKQLDNNRYSNALLLEISVPLNMPYITNQSEYERCSGTVEIKGVQYNFVKRKISNDTLHLLCLPNMNKTNLYRLKTDVAKQFSDSPSGKDSNQPTVKKSVDGKDYSNQFTQYSIINFIGNLSNDEYYHASLLKDCFVEFPGKPPQIII